MRDDSKVIPKKNTFEVPKKIIRTGKILQFFSSGLASNFVLKVFVTPPKFKTPERELMMRDSAKNELVTVPGIDKEIMVYTYGYSKTKILLTHGWAGRGTQLYEIADKLLENGMMVVAFDAPAHGLSKGATTTLPEYVEAIEYVNEIYGPFEAAIGHSFGGIALLAVNSKKKFINKLVTIGIEGSISKVIDVFVKKLQLKQKVADVMKKSIKATYKKDVESLSAIETSKKNSIPVLVLHDTQDSDVDVSSAYKIRQNLRNGQLLVTNGLGHRRILRDKKIIERIIDFIKT